MFKLAISGGIIIGKRFSVCRDERFLALVEVLRSADATFGHLEGTICDPHAPEVYPAAEAGWTWIRMPPRFAEELVWAGYNILSHASNHCLDYMYGGLYETWKALQEAGLPYAGTGRNLREARRPAYFDAGNRRVALVSSSSSTTDWARAADGKGDDGGRPGANQIRMIYRVDEQTAQSVRDLAVKMGWWLTEVDDDLMLNPPGLHNTVFRFTVSREPGFSGVSAMADPADVAANLASIREAKQRADFVVFHIHNHEWDPAAGLSHPPEFIRRLARDCIDAGADVFVAEGAHALLRGIEIYRGKPIFYDPGDLFKDGNSKIRPLSEYYWMRGRSEETGKWHVITVEAAGFAEKQKLPVPVHPPGGYNTGKVLAVIVPVCEFDDEGRLRQIRIHPATHLSGTFGLRGLPGLESGEEARKIIDYLGELSVPFGTRIEFDNGTGLIRVEPEA